jgi:hypothetical protein
MFVVGHCGGGCEYQTKIEKFQTHLDLRACLKSGDLLRIPPIAPFLRCSSSTGGNRGNPRYEPTFQTGFKRIQFRSI